MVHEIVNSYNQTEIGCSRKLEVFTNIQKSYLVLLSLVKFSHQFLTHGKISLKEHRNAILPNNLLVYRIEVAN